MCSFSVQEFSKHSLFQQIQEEKTKEDDAAEDPNDNRDDDEHDGADQTDDVQPDVPPSQRCATDQRDQRPQPLRQRAARGTLLGIKGQRIQGSQKVKQHVRRSQSQSSSCALLKASANVTRSYLSV